MNILKQLILMVLLALAPAIAAHGLNDFLQYREREQSIRETAFATAELRNSELNGIVIGMQRLLDTVSRMPAAGSRDWPACEAELKRLLINATADVVLATADPRGHVLCSSVGVTDPVEIGDRDFFQSTIASKAFTVGGYVQSRLTARPALVFGYPIEDETGAVVRIAVAYLSVEWLASELNRARFLPGQSLILTDQNGIVLAHLPLDDGGRVGRKVPAEYLRMLRAPASGALDMDDLAGHPAIIGYIPITLPPLNLYVLFVIEKRIAFAAITSAAWRSLGLSVLSLILGLAIASLIATRYIRNPVQGLLRASSRWGKGDYSARAAVGRACAELDQLAGQFNSMADAVELRNRQLSVSNRAKELILATAGHDLRQPLQIIASATSLLSKRSTSQSERRYLDAVQQAVGKLADGLDTLVEATRFHHEALNTAHVSFAAADLLTEATSLWSSKAQEKGIRLRVRPCNATIISNKKMLSTVLQNLVGNAIKYTEAGGVLVCCRKRPKQLWIEVYDTGVGIPEDMIETVFHQFKRLKSGQEGFGLGLWITRNTAEALGHVLSVRSIVGKGSRFRVVVPLALGADEAISTASPAAAASLVVVGV